MAALVSHGERLLEHHPFDPEVINPIVEIADQHRQVTSWDAYQRAQSFPEPEVYNPRQFGMGPIEVWDRVPPGGYDDVFAFWSTAGNPLGPNMLSRVSVPAEAMPNTRFIAFGSPPGFMKRAGSVPFWRLPTLWGGDYTPTVEPGLAYLQDQGIETSKQGGHSMGAEKPPVAATNAARFDHNVTHIISSDAATVYNRSIRKLIKHSRATDGPVSGYQEAADSPMYRDAIEQSDNSLPLDLHQLLYFSATNVAYLGALSRKGHEARMDEALETNPELRAGLIYAELSELAILGFISGIASGLDKKYPGRVESLKLKGQTHAYCNDIYLHGAVFLQVLRNMEGLESVNQQASA